MAIRTIQSDESLDSVWEELVYTEARLLKDPMTVALAVPITALIARTEEVQTGQRRAWRDEIVAQAGVDAGNDTLDEVVDEFSEELRHAEGGSVQTPRYRRYFKQPRNEIVRLALEAELGKVETWPASLASEPEAELKTLGVRLGHVMSSGGQALAERVSAAGRRADHRVRQIHLLIDDSNAARLSLYGTLLQVVTEQGRPRDWPNRFFRKSTPSPPRKTA